MAAWEKEGEGHHSFLLDKAARQKLISYLVGANKEDPPPSLLLLLTQCVCAVLVQSNLDIRNLDLRKIHDIRNLFAAYQFFTT